MPSILVKGLIVVAIVALSFWTTLTVLNWRNQPAADINPKPVAEQASWLPPSWKDWNEKLYLAVNPDVAAAVARGDFQSGRQHYEIWGIKERRLGASIPKEWDEANYLMKNPDVASAVAAKNFINGYHHYLAAGRNEKRAGGFAQSVK